MTNDHNTRIARNTIFLYFRMGISMLVSLYTSRVVLNALGVEDFGIWGVVGGIVSMFLFLNNSLSTSTSRFLTYAIGENNNSKLNIFFNTSLVIHFLLGILILIISETVGFWFLKNKLVIPVDKLSLAYVVFHFSVITSVISIILVPFNALIIAYERMSIFAYFTISDIIFKLLIAWLMFLLPNDRLGFYAFFLFIVSLVNAFFYFIYCRLKFKNLKLKLILDKDVCVSLTSFTSWSLVGNLAYVGYTQGLNMLLNMFFGPVVNAARTISYQIEQTIRTFTMNFQTAINPQIIKSYAQKDLEYMHSLVYASSKYSFYLLLLMSMPLMLETDMILTLWLKEVPEYTIQFVRLMMFIVVMETMSNSLMTSVVATGKIKIYHLIVGILLMLIVPISYLVLKMGMAPLSVFIVYLIVEVLACVARLIIVSSLIQLSKRDYFKKVLLKCSIVGMVSALLPVAIYISANPSFVRFILVTITSFMSVLCSIYLIGLTKNEKSFVLSKLMLLRRR